MRSVMLALRLVIVVALIVQVLWAQAGMRPAPPCSHAAPSSPLRVQDETPTKKGCCRKKMESRGGSGGCRAHRPGGAAPPPDAAQAQPPAGCDPANCRNCPAPRTPRPVDRIPSNHKQTAPPPAAPATLAVLIDVVHATIRPSPPGVLPASNNHRRASLCIWRN